MDKLLGLTTWSVINHLGPYVVAALTIIVVVICICRMVKITCFSTFLARMIGHSELSPTAKRELVSIIAQHVRR